MATPVKKYKRQRKRCPTRICAAILAFSIAAFFRPVINLRRTLSESPRIVILGHYESEETILCRGVHGGDWRGLGRIIVRIYVHVRSPWHDATRFVLMPQMLLTHIRPVSLPRPGNAVSDCRAAADEVQASGVRGLGRTVRRDVPWACWGQNGSMASNAFHLRNQTPKSRPSHARQL